MCASPWHDARICSSVAAPEAAAASTRRPMAKYCPEFIRITAPGGSGVSSARATATADMKSSKRPSRTTNVPDVAEEAAVRQEANGAADKARAPQEVEGDEVQVQLMDEGVAEEERVQTARYKPGRKKHV
mmetsp:Transcript_28481/g.80964  ORF Transcript_28481/g.80964 Transcript_28481/m.80964 type:complete len:130 (-) Transcript_28481:691-1080(-)